MQEECMAIGFFLMKHINDLENYARCAFELDLPNEIPVIRKMEFIVQSINEEVLRAMHKGCGISSKDYRRRIEPLIYEIKSEIREGTREGMTRTVVLSRELRDKIILALSPRK